MKLIKTIDACGHILCHDLTQIIVGITKDARFRKGHVVQAEDIPVLLSMGKENLYVWEKQPCMIHEDEAAMVLKSACLNKHMTASEPKEGKIELIAEIAGVFEVDVKRLFKINSLGKIVIATITNHLPVKKGDKLAGMKIIPLVIDEKQMEKVTAIANEANPLLQIIPYCIKNAAVLVTGNEVKNGIIADTFSSVIEKKLAAYGTQVTSNVLTGDEKRCITQSILDAIEQKAEIVICTGGMSVDPDDRTPGAIKVTKAKIVSYGTPVMPGVMMMLAYYKGVPILGLPGCAMYVKTTVFDVLLPRLLAKIPINKSDLVALGNGGLCLNCKPCVWPACAFAKS